jgi:hypothetical protein
MQSEKLINHQQQSSNYIITVSLLSKEKKKETKKKHTGIHFYSMKFDTIKMKKKQPV